FIYHMLILRNDRSKNRFFSRIVVIEISERRSCFSCDITHGCGMKSLPDKELLGGVFNAVLPTLNRTFAQFGHMATKTNVRILFSFDYMSRQSCAFYSGRPIEGIFKTSYFGIHSDVPCHANYEQIPQSLIEND